MSKETKINGYTLTEKMRKTRKKHPLTSTEQALFHELVAICNDDDWTDVFPCSNYDLCSPLQISENTLISARLKLIQVGLIFYKSGKSKRTHSEYSFTKKLTTAKTTSKFAVDTATNASVDVAVDASVDDGTNASDIIIEQTKTKTETKTFISPPLAVEEKTMYWKILVDVWFVFYKEKFGVDPTFNGQAAKSLKFIVETIEKSVKKANKDWTEEYAAGGLKHFLTLAYSDEWLKQNFLLNNLASKFDAIIQKRNGNNQTGKQATGAGVSTSSILERINAMPD